MQYEKKQYEKWIPVIHFLCSFLYEGIILIFQLDKMVVAAIPMSDTFSYTAERVMGYCISKLFAGIFIFFMWQLLFFCVHNWKKDAVVRVSVICFLIGLVLICLLYPSPFMRSEDNLITYSYGIRFFPEYWHSAYTSTMLCGMLMVIPHPVFISIFQWLFSVFVLGYVCFRIEHNEKMTKKSALFLVFLVLIPDTFILFTDAYRTELYALLCMFYLSVLLFDCLEGKKRSGVVLALLCMLSGFLAVWRTEGIVLGLLSYPAALFFVYKPAKKQSVCLICGLLASFAAFSIPQKLGDAKYYGKDYSFINSFQTLTNILNSSSANLSYEGIEEDLAALEQVTPVDILRVHSMDGYRRYNVTMGRSDINQSLATKEVGSAYMSAYYRLVLHNLPIYIKTQASMLTKILGITPNVYQVPANVLIENDLEPWTYDAWDIGKEDLLATPGTLKWSQNSLHLKVVEGVQWLTKGLAKIRRMIKLDTLFLILLPLLEILIFFKEAISFLKKKESNLGIAALCFILLGQAAAIVLFMPAAIMAYLHAYYYMTFLLVGAYLGSSIDKKGALQIK